MARKLTQEEFIERATKAHSGKYDYSKVEYVNHKTKVAIICPHHGIFFQCAHTHIYSKIGCPLCAQEQRKRLIMDWGYNDLYGAVGKTKEEKKCWKIWHDMLCRCYSDAYHIKRPTYIGCSVCEEWQKLSVFKQWFNEHYVGGWVLDKDILVKGNKTYSPETCCFVPQEINTLFIKRNALRGELPIGVTKNGNHYIPQISKFGRMVRGTTCRNINDAFAQYKEMKELYIKQLADKYRDQLEPRVYEALYNYQVEITD